MNKDTVKAAQEFLKTYGRADKDPYAMFRGIMLFKNEPHLLCLLHSLSNCAEFWIHYFMGSKHTRTICSKAHYGIDCEICALKNEYGPCYPRYVRTALVWDYSMIGKTWTPEAGKNKGVPQPLDPWGVMDFPRGEKAVNWNQMDRANTSGYGFADSPSHEMIWEVEHVEQVGFELRSVPASTLGTAVPRDPAKHILDWTKTASEDDIFGQQAATCHGVNWEAFGLKEPERPKKDIQGSDKAPYDKQGPKTTGRERKAQLDIKEDGEETQPQATQETKDKVATTTQALTDEKSDEDAELAEMQAKIEAKKKEKAAKEKAAKEAAAKAAKEEEERKAREALEKTVSGQMGDEDPEVAELEKMLAAKKAAKEAAAKQIDATPPQDDGAAARAAKKAELMAKLADLDKDADYTAPKSTREKLVTA